MDEIFILEIGNKIRNEIRNNVFISINYFIIIQKINLREDFYKKSSLMF